MIKIELPEGICPKLTLTSKTVGTRFIPSNCYNYGSLPAARSEAAIARKKSCPGSAAAGEKRYADR